MLQYYGYLWMMLGLGFVWFILFFLRKDLRKEILISSLLFSFLGIGEIAYSEYWSPPTLFNLIDHIGFSFEDILFMFFIGGISSCIFEVIMRKRDRTFRYHKHHHAFAFMVFILVVSFTLEYFYPLKTIYTLCGLAIVFGFILILRRKDLFHDAVFSGVFFTIIYTIFGLGVLQFVGFYDAYYHFENISGRMVFGNPVEEYLFGFSCGFLGSLLYKYFFNQKLTNMPHTAHLKQL